MKRVSVVLFGLALIALFSGCCCGHGCWPWWGGYGAACPGGACGADPNAPLVVPQGAAYQSYGSTQAGHPAAQPAPVAAAPLVQPGGVPLMAIPPLEALPTY